MRMFWTLPVGVAMAALMSVAACGNGTGGTGGTPGTGGAGTGGSTGNGTPVGCTSDAECLTGETCDTATGACMGTPPAGTSCQQCACMDKVAMGGCADACTKSLCTGATCGDNFCDGHPALTTCTKCLQDHCMGLTMSPDPTNPSSCM